MPRSYTRKSQKKANCLTALFVVVAGGGTWGLINSVNESDWEFPNPFADPSAVCEVVRPSIAQQKQCEQFRNSPAGRKLTQ